MKRITHNESIYTNELMSPGYVWYRCDVYSLPDNTGSGYHCVYRPLCRPDYRGTEIVTDLMMSRTREHYNAVAKMDALDEAARLVIESNMCDEMDKIDSDRRANGLCTHCGTYCDGDCISNKQTKQKGVTLV